MAFRTPKQRAGSILPIDARFYRSWTPEAQNTPAPATRSTKRKVLGSIVGAAAGFFAGGYIGASIDGECGGCDDPGLKGALIGAPIGAVAGGVLGYKFLF
jgi:hypothetical protein